jgi:hypothetical protein
LFHIYIYGEKLELLEDFETSFTGYLVNIHMSEFGEAAKQFAKKMSYTEYEAEEMTVKKAKIAGDVIADSLEEPRLDELCGLFDLDSDG